MAAEANSLAVKADTDEGEDTASYRQPPHNIQAEQAFLGAILVNNEALHHISTNLRAEHFYEPVHQRIFETILKFHDRGQIANPVTLKHYFDQDEALADIGGGEYLARLAAASASVISIRDYCDMIYDLAIKRSLIGIGEEVVNTAYAQEIDVTASEQIEQAEQELFNLASAGDAERSFRALRFGLNESVAQTEKAFKNQGKVTGVSTGLNDVDRLLGGLQNSDLLILAGRPSMGKTALATTIAYQASRFFVQEHKENPDQPLKSVGFFSLEMSAEQLAGRLLSSACNINASKLRRGDLSDDEFATLTRNSHELSNLPFFIDDTPALSIAALRARARRLKRVNNLGMLIVDYLQLVRATRITNQTNRVQEVSEITQGLKAIAKELNIPVLALSQLSRAVESREDKRPQLSDLRESGSIEQDADVVMFVYREEYYLMRSEPREDDFEKYSKWQEDMEKVHGLAEVLVSKQRNGPIGNVTLQFQSEFTRFEGLARENHLPDHH